MTSDVLAIIAVLEFVLIVSGIVAADLTVSLLENVSAYLSRKITLDEIAVSGDINGFFESFGEKLEIISRTVLHSAVKECAVIGIDTLDTCGKDQLESRIGVTAGICRPKLYPRSDADSLWDTDKLRAVLA